MYTKTKSISALCRKITIVTIFGKALIKNTYQVFPKGRPRRGLKHPTDNYIFLPQTRAKTGNICKLESFVDRYLQSWISAFVRKTFGFQIFRMWESLFFLKRNKRWTEHKSFVVQKLPTLSKSFRAVGVYSFFTAPSIYFICAPHALPAIRLCFEFPTSAVETRVRFIVDAGARAFFAPVSKIEYNSYVELNCIWKSSTLSALCLQNFIYRSLYTYRYFLFKPY